MRAIKELEKSGYIFSVDINIKHDGSELNNKTDLNEWFEQIKENKQEAISYIRRRIDSSVNVKAQMFHDDLCIHIADNIRKSEALRRDVNKMIKAEGANVNKDLLIDMLIQIVALLTSDELFYKQNHGGIKNAIT